MFVTIYNQKWFMKKILRRRENGHVKVLHTLVDEIGSTLSEIYYAKMNRTSD
jgi:hypothetical protein